MNVITWGGFYHPAGRGTQTNYSILHLFLKNHSHRFTVWGQTAVRPHQSPAGRSTALRLHKANQHEQLPFSLLFLPKIVFIFMCTGIFPVFMSAHHVSQEDRREHRIPGDWSYRRLVSHHQGVGNWTLWNSSQCPISPFPPPPVNSFVSATLCHSNTLTQKIYFVCFWSVLLKCFLGGKIHLPSINSITLTESSKTLLFFNLKFLRPKKS